MGHVLSARLLLCGTCGCTCLPTPASFLSCPPLAVPPAFPPAPAPRQLSVLSRMWRVHEAVASIVDGCGHFKSPEDGSNTESGQRQQTSEQNRRAAAATKVAGPQVQDAGDNGRRNSKSTVVDDSMDGRAAAGTKAESMLTAEARASIVDKSRTCLKVRVGLWA